MRSLLLCSMSLSLCIAFIAPSRTDAQTETTVDEARAVFSHGMEAYDAGSFEQALADFQRAYELTHDAQILYNVGTVADRLRRDAVALEAYEGYLAGYPGAPDRANVEARIAALRAVVRTPEPIVDVAPPETPETVDEPVEAPAPRASAAARRMGEGGVAFLVTGGVLVLGGAALLIAAAVETDAANHADTWAAFMGPYERVPLLSAVGWISLGLGGALAALGVGWLVASSGSAEDATLALRVGPLHLSLEGTF